MTWEEAVEDPTLQSLPYKVELNGDGNMVMSPTRLTHGGYQEEIGFWLRTLLNGKMVMEAAVRTSDNVKVPDAAWFTWEHWKNAQHELAASTAAAICVEVASKSSYQREFSEKKTLYFEAGAKEGWFCDMNGNMTFHTPEEQVAASPLCPSFPAKV